MNEQKLIKKQLIKNMFYTFIVFTVILVFFDVMIYNQAYLFLYKSIDEELTRTSQNYNKLELKETLNKRSIPEDNKIISMMEFKINPRLIYIIRDNEGNITNSDSIGRFYKDYLYEITFDKNSINKIYSISFQNTYNYRGITINKYNEVGEEYYVQLLANVDGETETINNLRNSLLIRKYDNYCNFNNIFVYIIKKDTTANT